MMLERLLEEINSMEVGREGELHGTYSYAVTEVRVGKHGKGYGFCYYRKVASFISENLSRVRVCINGAAVGTLASTSQDLDDGYTCLCNMVSSCYD